jgi:hypothetical protein
MKFNIVYYKISTYYTISDGYGNYLMADPDNLGNIITRNDPTNSYAQWLGNYIQNKANKYYLSAAGSTLHLQSQKYFDFSTPTGSNTDLIKNMVNYGTNGNGIIQFNLSNNANDGIYFLGITTDNPFTFTIGTGNSVPLPNFTMYANQAPLNIISTTPFSATTSNIPNNPNQVPTIVNSTTTMFPTTTNIPSSSLNIPLIIGLGVTSGILFIILLCLILI